MNDLHPPPKPSPDPVIKLDNIHKRFGEAHVLRGINLDVSAGENVVIIGASGSGKSTLLRCINFLEVPDDGRVHINGTAVGSVAPGKPERLIVTEQELSHVRRQVGMVFQQFNLFPHMTVIQNVMEGWTTLGLMETLLSRERRE